MHHPRRTRSPQQSHTVTPRPTHTTHTTRNTQRQQKPSRPPSVPLSPNQPENYSPQKPELQPLPAGNPPSWVLLPLQSLKTKLAWQQTQPTRQRSLLQDAQTESTEHRQQQIDRTAFSRQLHQSPQTEPQQKSSINPARPTGRNEHRINHLRRMLHQKDRVH